MTVQKIDVVIGAVITGGKILLVKRPTKNFNGLLGTAIIGDKSIEYVENAPWFEFPGGKINAGESLTVALVREIKEEVGLIVSVGDKVATVLLDVIYSNGKSRRINLHCFTCSVATNQEIELSNELAFGDFFDIAEIHSIKNIDPLIFEYLSKITLSK